MVVEEAGFEFVEVSVGDVFEKLVDSETTLINLFYLISTIRTT